MVYPSVYEGPPLLLNLSTSSVDRNWNFWKLRRVALWPLRSSWPRRPRSRPGGWRWTTRRWSTCLRLRSLNWSLRRWNRCYWPARWAFFFVCLFSKDSFIATSWCKLRLLLAFKFLFLSLDLFSGGERWPEEENCHSRVSAAEERNRQKEIWDIGGETAEFCGGNCWCEQSL